MHAGSARQALTRLRFITQLSEVAQNLPLAALNALVADSIDLVVHSERGPAGPRVTEIVAVEDLAGGPAAVQFTTTEVFARPGPDAPLRWTGLVPARLGERMARRGTDLRQVLAGDEGVRP
ncbi:MAG: hypothetical protein ACKO04_01250 [Actinomycetes bacterium]